MTQKLLCVGHTTLDTFIEIEHPDLHCDVNNKNCEVCFEFGKKLPVSKVHYGIGGGAANVAVGTSNLGLQTYIYSIIGKGHKGSDVEDSFKNHQVNCDYLLKDDNPTDQATIISYTVDRTVFTYNHKRHYTLKDVKDTFQEIFISSIGDDVSEIYKELADLKEKITELRIFYNPGSRELKNQSNLVSELLTSVDYFISNVEEACMALNSGLKRDQIDVEDLTELLIEKGVKNVVMTDGVNGSYVANESSFNHVPAELTKVVEKTGAGDAYAAGFIASTLYGNDLVTSAKWGTLNSAAVIKEVGAQEGLLSLDKMNSLIKS